ncbi:9646_t:CDS:2 [Diversispora eburnea]|uniref:9646_t:CDS:1 n=1 Tax=Diversispora eburnea TaxID=1213867 RepID=A0A9N9EZE5_9GLOM|nr:9646_t:CDS:2 [Diversispora eburnea]
MPINIKKENDISKNHEINHINDIENFIEKSLTNSQSSHNPPIKKSLVKRVPRTWAFFYYENGHQMCGNYCIVTFSILGGILLLIILCGICSCYRIKKTSGVQRSETGLNDMALSSIFTEIKKNKKDKRARSDIKNEILKTISKAHILISQMDLPIDNIE